MSSRGRCPRYFDNLSPREASENPVEVPDDASPLGRRRVDKVSSDTGTDIILEAKSDDSLEATEREPFQAIRKEKRNGLSMPPPTVLGMVDSNHDASEGIPVNALYSSTVTGTPINASIVRSILALSLMTSSPACSLGPTSSGLYGLRSVLRAVPLWRCRRRL